MPLNIYTICKEDENSILCAGENNKPIVARLSKATNPIHLLMSGGSLGILMKGNVPFAVVEVKKHDNKFAFLNKLNEKFFSSQPIMENDFVSFAAHKSIANKEALFSLRPADIHLHFDAPSDFTSFFLNFLHKKELNDKKVGLYWWRKKGGTINFGDELNPHLVSFLSGRPVKKVNVSDVDLLGVGSILGTPPDREKPYKVWGSGTLAPRDLLVEKYTPYLLRGPLTRSLFDTDFSVPYGDPGLIVNRVWERSQKVSHKWGIIPHHTQLERPWVRKLLENTPDSILIRADDPDLKKTMALVSSCEFIASSSLHGLIVADSYQVPNVWLWESAMHKGGQWKFFDYFSGVGRTYVNK